MNTSDLKVLIPSMHNETNCMFWSPSMVVSSCYIVRCDDKKWIVVIITDTMLASFNYFTFL